MVGRESCLALESDALKVPCAEHDGTGRIWGMRKVAKEWSAFSDRARLPRTSPRTQSGAVDDAPNEGEARRGAALLPGCTGQYQRGPSDSQNRCRSQQLPAIDSLIPQQCKSNGRHPDQSGSLGGYWREKVRRRLLVEPKVTTTTSTWWGLTCWRAALQTRGTMDPGEQVDREAAMSPCSKEGHEPPGLH
ncbi:hypothetical protein QYF61_005733 [Mycteria americana]|uniref:Uncharacterized protein n=1 Tax=Mycteria americana TaxID=33587 RepID=A0AAN7S2N2_MYCAM|nr:hypothetical protein QYF61_005733 [Mycteria americana]